MVEEEKEEDKEVEKENERKIAHEREENRWVKAGI